MPANHGLNLTLFKWNIYASDLKLSEFDYRLTNERMISACSSKFAVIQEVPKVVISDKVLFCCTKIWSIGVQLHTTQLEILLSNICQDLHDSHTNQCQFS